MYEALTLPSAFPPCGRDVNRAYRTHPEDLLAQKVSLFVPAVCECRFWYTERQSLFASQATSMDLVVIAAIAMLAVWGVAIVFFEAPGWMHVLLTVGLFLLLWRIATRNAAKRDHE
jgi:hypothetical protein